MNNTPETANKTAYPINMPEVFVLHIKHGYEKRGKHIERMLGEMGIPFKYILDGDISDLTENILETYFNGSHMKRAIPATSCTYKHLLAYKELVREKCEGALILEDDIILRGGGEFLQVFYKSIDELNKYSEKHFEPVIIPYEDTRLRFVPRSRRVKGTVLYKGDRDRMAGCYYINAKAAELLINYAETQKFDTPIDITHCHLLKQKVLTYFWCQPTIASQGSHTGAFASAINFNKSFIYPLIWQIKLTYKKFLYWLR